VIRGKPDGDFSTITSLEVGMVRAEHVRATIHRE
jgi:hypothetical protein